MKNFSDQKKGTLLAFVGIMFITPDSLLIRLSNVESWTLIFYRGFIPFLVVFIGIFIHSGLISICLKSSLSTFRLMFCSSGIKSNKNKSLWWNIKVPCWFSRVRNCLCCWSEETNMFSIKSVEFFEDSCLLSNLRGV